MPLQTERELMLKAKDQLKEDAKMITQIVGILLYGKELTSSRRARAWNVVQAMGNTFNEMIRTDKPAEFVAGHKRLEAAYGGIRDIMQFSKT